MTQAFETYLEILHHLGDDGAVLIGTNAHLLDEDSIEIDTDVAVHWDRFIKTMGVYKYTHLTLGQFAPIHTEGIDYREVTYTDGVSTTVCSYLKNEKTLWEGVTSTKFEDGSKLDILWYSKRSHIKAIADVMNILKETPNIFLKENKDKRIRKFEELLFMVNPKVFTFPCVRCNELLEIDLRTIEGSGKICTHCGKVHHIGIELVGISKAIVYCKVGQIDV